VLINKFVCTENGILHYKKRICYVDNYIFSQELQHGLMGRY